MVLLRSRRRPSHLLAALAVVLAIQVVGVSSAAGLTVKRTWTASIGTGAANGTSQLYGFTNGTGFLAISLKRMSASRTWSAVIHRGSCSKLGTRVLWLGSVRTRPDGTAVAGFSLSGTRMSLAWKATWSASTISLRLVSGSTVRCATYGFPRATRVVVSGMGINLPVIEGPKNALYCDVAMYLRELSQPGEPGASMIYAHARTGMFLPLLTASRIRNGASMIGRTVRVYTSSSRYYNYRITQVRRGQRTIQAAFGVTGKILWLQTSEGPFASSTKLVVVATQVGGPYRATYAASHPKPRPHSC